MKKLVEELRMVEKDEKGYTGGVREIFIKKDVEEASGDRAQEVRILVNVE